MNDDSRSTPEPEQSLAILESLRDHYFWLPRLFSRAEAWQWLVPWPLLAIAPRFRKSQAHGSVWLTIVAITLAVLDPDQFYTLSEKEAGDIGRTLFAGAFLVMTMLSVSVAMPGQAIMRLVLKKNSQFAIDFIAPTLWAFCWGVTGGLLMTFCNPSPKPSTYQVLVSGVAMYAFAMEINAVLFTIRSYAIGLVLAGRE